jgi:hypothetical protein
MKSEGMAASTRRADNLQTFNHARHLLTDFCITDLDVALTFLAIAKTSSNDETVQRNLKNARIAYETVLRYLPRLPLTKAEQQSIQVKLASVKARLDAFGD